MLHRMKWAGILSIVLALLVASPMTRAEQANNLEQRVMELEKQNNELRAMVQDLLTEVRQQKTDVQEVKQTQEKSLSEKAQSVLGSKTKWGGDWRLRGVMFDNMWNFDTAAYDDSWEFYRMRTRFWVDTQLLPELRFYFRAANEYKWGIDSKANTLLLDPDFDSLIGNKELFVDNAYIEWQEPLNIANLTLKIGRQDLIYGEGFMILDGQDNVGSMAIGFDGIKATVDVSEDAKLDLFMMKIEEKRKERADDEDLYGAYLTWNNVFEKHKLELYGLHRNKRSMDDYGAAATPTTGVWLDPEQSTTALGARMSGSLFTEGFSYAAEGVYQFGELKDVDGFFFPGYVAGDDIDRKAWGGYVWGKYTFLSEDWKPYIKVMGMYASGDDPDTSDYEGFDSFYAEWPKFSEGLVYQMYDPFAPLKGGTDGDLGVWTNLMIARAEVGAQPTEAASVLLAYQHMWADEETGLGNDDDRGDLVQGILSYNFNKHLSGHLLGEYFWPDDYYPSNADDAFFARYQMMLKF